MTIRMFSTVGRAIEKDSPLFDETIWLEIESIHMDADHGNSRRKVFHPEKDDAVGALQFLGDQIDFSIITKEINSPKSISLLGSFSFLTKP